MVLVQGDMVTGLEGMLQSLRLWNRAIDTLARLRSSANSTPAPAAAPEDPFAMQTVKDALTSIELQQGPQAEGNPKNRNANHKQIDGLEWRIVDGLLNTLFSLGHAYLVRGSPREAEYFIQQAQDVAQSYNAQAMVSRALSRKGEIQLHQGLLEVGYNSIIQAAELLQDTLGVDAADIERLRGDYNHLSEKEDDAGDLYLKATAILEELDKVFTSFDADPTG
jgi:separase